MGLFDFLRRRPMTAAELREALIQASDRREEGALAALCQKHQREIRESFPLWLQVPEPIRDDPTARDRYCLGILDVAQVFEQGGDRSLVELILADEARNPMMAWEMKLREAQSMIDDGRPGEAIALPRPILSRTAGIEASTAEYYLPRTYGMLGVAYFRVGEKAKTVEFTEKARALCEKLGDAEGVAAYTRSLRHVEEGGTVIFRGADGRALTLDEVRNITGTFRFEILGVEQVPQEARALHEDGRRAGSAGDYGKALSYLERASRLAPRWPYPVYDIAFTYLLMEDFDKARTYYQKTVDLAPRGFFTAIQALDTLVREQKGDLPLGTYLEYVSLEWLDDLRQKAEKVRRLAERAPTFAPVWKEVADLSEDDAEKLASIEKGLAARPDAETRGLLEVNKALILHRKGDRDGAVRLLGELALDPASTYATEHMAKAALGSLSRRERGHA